MEGWNIEEPIDASAMKRRRSQNEWAQPTEGDEDDRQERSAEDEDARPVAVGEIAYTGLDDEGEHPHHPDDQADLGQRKGEFLDEDRQERVDEGDIEIAR